MSRKIFISFLGTTNYMLTHYSIDGVKSKPVRFVQEALIDHFCTDWTEEDRIMIFFTEDSQKKNWSDNGQNYITEDVERIGLNSILSNKPYSTIVEGILIKEGFSEEEIWSIFNTVYNKLKDNDEIYFDVTHAFRSIPLFSTVLFNFARFTKRVFLKSVHYGAFEILGPSYLVKNIPLEQRIAPIIDLTGLIELQKFNEIANAFIEYGRISHINNLFAEKENSQNNAIRQAISRIKIASEKLEGYILTNRTKEIISGKYVENLNGNINQYINHKEIASAKIEILKKLNERLSVFSKNSENNIIEAIKWAYNYNMIPQAYTMGQEYIISLVCSKFREYNFYQGIPTKDSERKFREYIAAILGIKERDIINQKFEGKLLDNVDVAQNLLDIVLIKDIRRFYYDLARYRNIINHAKNGDYTVTQFKEIFERSFFPCVELLNQPSSKQVAPKKISTLFLNLTNHPSNLWCDKQLEAARTFGEIMDMPFPMIDETDNETYISALADEYFQKILELAKDKNVTVHLMGELTFTFALLKRLQEYGIPCVASTSKRIVKEESAGRKSEVIFQFERFRRYE